MACVFSLGRGLISRRPLFPDCLSIGTIPLPTGVVEWRARRRRLDRVTRTVISWSCLPGSGRSWGRGGGNVGEMFRARKRENKRARPECAVPVVWTIIAGPGRRLWKLYKGWYICVPADWAGEPSLASRIVVGIDGCPNFWCGSARQSLSGFWLGPRLAPFLSPATGGRFGCCSLLYLRGGGPGFASTSPS